MGAPILFPVAINYQITSNTTNTSLTISSVSATEAVQSNKVYPPQAGRGSYFCVSIRQISAIRWALLFTGVQIEIFNYCSLAINSWLRNNPCTDEGSKTDS
jgi:hypothetical protein